MPAEEGGPERVQLDLEDRPVASALQAEVKAAGPGEERDEAKGPHTVSALGDA